MAGVLSSYDETVELEHLLLVDAAPVADFERYECEGFCCYYGAAVTAIKPTEKRCQFEIVVPLNAVNTAAVQTSGLEKGSVSLCLGQICIIPPEQPYRIQIEEPSEMILIHLPIKTMMSAVQEALRSPRWTLESKYAISDETIVTLSKSLKKWLTKTDAIATLYRRTIIRLLSVHIVATYAQADIQLQQDTISTIQDAKLGSVIQYIKDHLEEDLKVVILAEVAGLSPSHFSRLFKRSVGLSPRQYILSQRIRFAKTLLKDDRISLSTISFRCGFYDQSHFIFQFRRFTGMTPSAYRGEHTQRVSIQRYSQEKVGY